MPAVPSAPSAAEEALENFLQDSRTRRTNIRRQRGEAVEGGEVLRGRGGCLPWGMVGRRGKLGDGDLQTLILASRRDVFRGGMVQGRGGCGTSVVLYLA